MPPINLGWKTIQEQIGSSCALVLEAWKVEGDCLMDELKTVPNKLVVEDKYEVDYPIEQKTEPDKLWNSTTKAVQYLKDRRNPQ
jgi:hypothetical protein